MASWLDSPDVLKKVYQTGTIVPPFSFVLTDDVPLLASTALPKRSIIGFIMKPISNAVSFSQFEPLDYPCATVYFMSAFNVVFGYYIVIKPMMRLKLYAHSVLLYDPKATTHSAFLEDVKPVYQNETLLVVYALNRVLMMSWNEKYKYIDPEFLRGGH